MAAYMYPLMQALQQAHQPLCNKRIYIAALEFGEGSTSEGDLTGLLVACLETGLLGEICVDLVISALP